MGLVGNVGGVLLAPVQPAAADCWLIDALQQPGVPNPRVVLNMVGPKGDGKALSGSRSKNAAARPWSPHQPKVALPFNREYRGIKYAGVYICPLTQLLDTVEDALVVFSVS